MKIDDVLKFVNDKLDVENSLHNGINLDWEKISEVLELNKKTIPFYKKEILRQIRSCASSMYPFRSSFNMTDIQYDGTFINILGNWCDDDGEASTADEMKTEFIDAKYSVNVSCNGVFRIKESSIFSRLLGVGVIGLDL